MKRRLGILRRDASGWRIPWSQLQTCVVTNWLSLWFRLITRLPVSPISPIIPLKHRALKLDTKSGPFVLTKHYNKRVPFWVCEIEDSLWKPSIRICARNLVTCCSCLQPRNASRCQLSNEVPCIGGTVTLPCRFFKCNPNALTIDYSVRAC